ncbi:hypothetical protein [Streptosporangium carneum]|uniref:hypothetical protein n=1 Tax=Streptosporangium carneum TaxID=47481 RepID=UPI0022F2BA9D|nr:hypothetical protein [Streptosporangium carneum]
MAAGHVAAAEDTGGTAGGPTATRARPGTAGRAAAAPRDTAPRSAGNGEESIQTVPFLVGSGLILLTVALVFHGTLHADRKMERTRRSRLRRRLERSNDGLARPVSAGEEPRELDAPESEAEPGAQPGPVA